MQVQPDDLDAGEPARQRVDLERAVVRDAELVVAAAGADLVVGQRGDVGVDAQRHRRAQPAGGSDLAERDQLRHRLRR